MSTYISMGSETAVFLLLAVIYVAGRKYIEICERRNKTASDEEVLAAISYERRCSEFDLFQLAGRQWHTPGDVIQQDFKRYLTAGLLPHYIRDYIRKNRPSGNAGNPDRNAPSLPASWSA
jgi:hypothetical protein